MKCIILLVIFAMAQHEGVTGLPQPDPRCAEGKCEELYKLLEDSTIYGRRLYRDNLINFVKCKWDRLESSYQYFKNKFEQFVHDLRHGFLPQNIASHNTTQTNVTSTVSTPDKPINNHQPTPVKIDEEAKPEDNKDQLTSQNPASSKETQEKETSLTPDKSTVNQKSTSLDSL